jgi:hypothetical protein
MVTSEVVWVCGVCRTVYTTYHDAESCCGHESIRETVYICSACRLEYDSEADALECERNHRKQPTKPPVKKPAVKKAPVKKPVAKKVRR